MHRILYFNMILLLVHTHVAETSTYLRLVAKLKYDRVASETDGIGSGYKNLNPAMPTKPASPV
jgi:hypothetical protein